ncbi:MAG: fibronectin type III domain-containing protein [Candidatus Aminicenantes bacterium]|nr:fibronectin type III domain-containing protein [Candidatus Aminicenantes bacterium]
MRCKNGDEEVEKIIVFLLSALIFFSPLSIGELNCLLWMDESGRVLELRETGAPFVEPVCFIDVSTKTLRKEAEALHFDVYEQNKVRTRWRLSPRGTAGTVTKKILFQEKSGVELCLGTLRLRLKHVAWDIKEFSQGLYHVQFHGPTIAMHQSLVYEKAVGMIYSEHEWDNKFILEQRRTQVARPEASDVAAIPSQERAALIALYNSTDGDNWSNKKGWKTPPLAADGFALPGSEKNWYGITCDSRNTTVKSISLYNNNLNGFLPPELGILANLQILRLYSNQLRGTIPSELANLTNLQGLWLYYNQISGTIPPELGNLKNLRYLLISANQLSGIIPPELGNLAYLIELYLNNNQLSGYIPPELGNLAYLEDLKLSNNRLSGTIPPVLGNLAKLKCFDLSVNQFSGAISPELGRLTKSIRFALSSNQLSGSIPPELGNLPYVRFFDLRNNQISGSIPMELGNLVALVDLFLNGNRLSGTIPPELGKLADLQSLYLGDNQLSGTIPPELGNLVKLCWFGIRCNQLSGSIPPELGKLAKLEGLKLHSNHLSGNIPPELGNLANLQELWLNSNHLSGSIPLELGNLANLKWLCLESNQISGSIPANLMNLRELNDNTSDFRWNALYTNYDTLRVFLNRKQYGGNWESTQTIAPANVTATALSTSSIDIHWTPITYTSDSGGYRVFYSTTPGGPYAYFGIAANKTASSLIVTGLNPGATHYFVVQTRTSPHGDNLNTVDSEYSAEVSALTLYSLILTSPNGGESWGLSTIRNITWTSSGLSGNIRLELWKADKKLGALAADIPIGSGNYAWFVGNCGPGVASTGNDYKVKIITANGLYNDASNAAFSIIQPSLTLTSPRGNENWKLGTQQNLTWTSAGLTGNVRLLLFKGGVQVGVIARGIPIANGTYAWTVGRYSGGMAPVGSNYSVKIRSEDNRFYNSGSGAFTLQ